MNTTPTNQPASAPTPVSEVEYRKKTVRIILCTVAAMLAAMLILISVGVFDNSRTVSRTGAEFEYRQALAHFTGDRAVVRAQVADGREMVSLAADALEFIGGTNGSLERDALAAAIADARTKVNGWGRAVNGVLPDGSGLHTAFWDGGAGFKEAAAVLDEAQFPTVDLEEVAAPLQAALLTLGGPELPAFAVEYTLPVAAAGWQDEVDECDGAVDVTAKYGVPTVVEHWSCGGSEFPQTPGAIVHLTGAIAGDYQVVGVVDTLNIHTDDTTDLPVGYDLLFQTCQNGSSATMSFTGLAKVAGGAGSDGGAGGSGGGSGAGGFGSGGGAPLVDTDS